MEDNAPCHWARSVKTWMASHNLNFMELWPPQSPDLNPIHVWNILEKKLVEKKLKNLKELEEKIREEWLKIPTIEIQNLISSMPSRVAAVITAKGSQSYKVLVFVFMTIHVIINTYCGLKLKSTCNLRIVHLMNHTFGGLF